MLKTAFIASMASLCLSPLAYAGEAEDFQSILDDHWATATKEQVFFRTDPDAFRMNGKLPAFSEEARARRQAFNEGIIARLESIDTDQLEGQDRISFQTVFL